MKEITNKSYGGERPLFQLTNHQLKNVTITKGESGLKKSSRLTIIDCIFEGKYPLWHADEIMVKDSLLQEGARAAIWYSSNITLQNTRVEAPKIFRDASKITLNDCTLYALDSFWDTTDITINNTTLKGQYQFLHASNIQVDNLNLEGNYSFQHTSDVIIRNSKLQGKDLFWNSNNITVYDSTIDAEYLGWYSTNLTLINCKITGTQALCYIDNLVMKDCDMINTDFAFEETILDVTINSTIESVKNPKKGTIVSKGIKQYIDEFESIVTIKQYEEDKQ